eukprot:GHVT01053112.1.p1 GENE.GHVT01053112.1~~GHVT01053112.1.p1  ORF type:complete len:523 (-),score=72.03 GHVT01053112.1:1694-3262(-)
MSLDCYYDALHRNSIKAPDNYPPPDINPIDLDGLAAEIGKGGAKEKGRQVQQRKYKQRQKRRSQETIVDNSPHLDDGSNKENPLKDESESQDSNITTRPGIASTNVNEQAPVPEAAISAYENSPQQTGAGGKTLGPDDVSDGKGSSADHASPVHIAAIGRVSAGKALRRPGKKVKQIQNSDAAVAHIYNATKKQSSDQGWTTIKSKPENTNKNVSPKLAPPNAVKNEVARASLSSGPQIRQRITGRPARGTKKVKHQKGIQAPGQSIRGWGLDDKNSLPNNQATATRNTQGAAGEAPAKKIEFVCNTDVASQGATPSTSQPLQLAPDSLSQTISENYNTDFPRLHSAKQKKHIKHPAVQANKCLETSGVGSSSLEAGYSGETTDSAPIISTPEEVVVQAVETEDLSEPPVAVVLYERIPTNDSATNKPTPEKVVVQAVQSDPPSVPPGEVLNKRNPTSTSSTHADSNKQIYRKVYTNLAPDSPPYTTTVKAAVDYFPPKKTLTRLNTKVRHFLNHCRMFRSS